MTALPQLRVRTEFSFRSGGSWGGVAAFGGVARIAARLAEIGAPGAGIVDGSTWGLTRWAAGLAKCGQAPFFGVELGVPMGDGRRPTAWALASDPRALTRLSTAARREGADPLALFREATGVLRFAGTALSDPATFDYIDVNPASPLATRRALRLAAGTGKPLVVTSDNAYPALSDRAAFLALGGRESTTPQHLLSIDELRAALPLSAAQFDEAVGNTIAAAARCATELPKAPLIKVKGDLRAEVEKGRQYRLAAGHIRAWTPEHEARVAHELRLIEEKAFESYFLVVADLITWAKARMLVGPGRGSSAGSLVCYLLRITEVDPLVHSLLFERFIDVTRADLPDIDIDFNDQKRELVFGYLREKYGAEHVARIGNVITLKPKSVLAEVGKRLGIPKHETFAVANVLQELSSGDSRYGKGLEDAMNNTAPGREFAEAFPAAKVMFEVENHAWHTGVHAAGVIVCNEPIADFATVGRDGVAHIDKPAAETLNLLKIDALGLRTLGVIEDAGVVTGEELYALTLDDPEVFRVFNERKFGGIFQFEGPAQRSVSSQIDVNSFQRLDHITALARPGPLGGGAANHYIFRAAGTEPVEFRHPSMEPYLGPTMGTILYQEQVMRIGADIGRMSWKEVTLMRKAMSGRKGEEFFNQLKASFLKGAQENGLDEGAAEGIWHEINTFGAWGMNKCVKFDTRVKLAHPNQSQERAPTIEQLYIQYKESPSAWIRQRRSMPVLLCVGPDGVARPRMAQDIHKNGPKTCVRLEFDDGSFVECTEDHRFIIDGAWKAALQSRIGSEFSVVERDTSSTSTVYLPGVGKGWRKGRTGAGKYDKLGGKKQFSDQFRSEHEDVPCEDCGAVEARMEGHHNDFCGGLDRPSDMAWLCCSCHKLRHIQNGTRRAPYARGHLPAPPKTLVRYIPIGVHETYDIEMPAPDHNYVLASGIITHNSHTVSYAIISYWCGWMKRYHPLEYAAACLRSAKDEDQAYEILRELVAEGTSYVAFDIDRSRETWAVIDGRLLGGFQNVAGIGPVKSRTLVEKRDAGRLTEKERAKILASEVALADLRPAHSIWGHLYDDPSIVNVHGGEIEEFANLPDHKKWESAVVIGQVKGMKRRDRNEAVLVKRRNGERFHGQPLFLDIYVVDDSISKPATARIGERMWGKVGQKLADRLVADKDWLLMRGRWLKQFNILLVEKVICLSRPEVIE